MKLYLITGPRSGSTVMSEYLNSHPQICFPQTEYFHPHQIQKHPWWVRLAPMNYLNTMLRMNVGKQRPDFVGCKIMYYQLEERLGSLVPLRRGRARFIHLVRQNTFAQFLSMKESQATGRWHHRDGERAEAPPKIQINLAEMASFLTVVNARKKKYAEELADAVTVEYETFSQDPEAGMKLIAEQLGVCGFAPQSTIRRNRHRPLQDRVSNADEVRLHLDRLGYQHYWSE
jgi:LPS sulfotransferase NodH